MFSYTQYLSEAKANASAPSSEDKLKHLEHAEDHPINAGAEGYNHAIKTLHAVHQAMQGKPSDASITTKYDGSPSIVFGHHPVTGKFFVASKSAFNKDPKLNYTADDIEQNHGHAPGLVEKLKQGLAHLPKVAPDKGIYQGDVMHSGKKDLEKVGDEFHWKPNVITYTAKQGSPEGQKAAKSKFGVVVHTKYTGKDLETMKAGPSADASKSFKEHSDVHVMHPNLDPTQAHMTDSNHKEFDQHMKEAEEAHKKLSKGGGYNALARHTDNMKTFINSNVAKGTTPTHEGFVNHITERGTKDIAKLKTEKGKSARQNALDLSLKQLYKDKPHIESGLNLHKHLQNAKNVLVNGLDATSNKPVGTQTNGKATAGEGYVAIVNGRPTKLVNRAEFSANNFNARPRTPKPAPANVFDKSISEAVERNVHHVLAFGRMNPITSGHEAVVKKIHDVAQANNADHTLVVSHSQDAKKNPLSAEQKVRHAKRAFPDTNVKAASKTHPTILHHAAELHKQGVQHLHVVAGSDRVGEMHDLLHKYNGKASAHGAYNFNNITVHSAGQRDPDAEGTTGISASKMREHATTGNKKDFRAGAPASMTTQHKDEMYNDVRHGMGVK